MFLQPSISDNSSVPQVYMPGKCCAVDCIVCTALFFFFLYSSFTVFSMLTLQRSEKSRHLPAECFVDGQNCCRKSCVCCIGSCEHPLWPCCCRISLTFCIFIFIWGATRDSTWPYAFYHVSAWAWRFMGGPSALPFINLASLLCKQNPVQIIIFKVASLLTLHLPVVGHLFLNTA